MLDCATLRIGNQERSDTFMERFAAAILHHRRTVLTVFILALLLSALLSTLVRVDYDLSHYLPPTADSTQAIEALRDTFQDSIPDLDMVLPVAGPAEGQRIREELARDPEVRRVRWLNDVADLSVPLEVADPALVETFYKDGLAHYLISLNTADYTATLNRLRQTYGEDSAFGGQAVSLSFAARATSTEIVQVVLFAVPMAFLILLLSTTSWFEPVLFMISAGVGVILNLGTNAFLGKISFITYTVGAVLQLAVSMDYSVFLLNNFGQHRSAGDSVEDAMRKAIAKAFSAIASSAATTFFGFLALVLMQFRIGPDMGFVLAKGIVFSLLSSIFLLPVLVTYTYRIIDRSTHRSLLPGQPRLRRWGRAISALTPLVLILVLLTSYPLLRSQQLNSYQYGNSNYAANSREARDQALIEEHFGRSQMLVLMVPSGEMDKEAALAQALQARPEITDVTSYASSVGSTVPEILVPGKDLEQLHRDGVSRYIVTTTLHGESPEVFQSAEELRALVEQYYPGQATWAGEAFSLLDMRDIVQHDNVIVNGVIILTVFLLLVLTFRSLSLPLILVFTIEYAIWCNMATLYFKGTSILYIGYLVISTIQLGATVDYAILLAQNYLDFRQQKSPREAAIEAIALTLPAILPPALILAVTGYALYFISTLSAVQDIGLVLGRGALYSFLSVVLLLPALLRLLDAPIRYSTLSKGERKLLARSLRSARDFHQSV